MISFFLETDKKKITADINDLLGVNAVIADWQYVIKFSDGKLIQGIKDNNRLVKAYIKTRNNAVSSFAELQKFVKSVT